MREGIRKLQPKVWRGTRGHRQLFSQLNLGAITRVERGGYRLEGPIFATGDRQGIHAIVEQFMDRIDQALDEALDAEPPMS